MVDKVQQYKKKYKEAEAVAARAGDENFFKKMGLEAITKITDRIRKNPGLDLEEEARLMTLVLRDYVESMKPIAERYSEMTYVLGEKAPPERELADKIRNALGDEKFGDAATLYKEGVDQFKNNATNLAVFKQLVYRNTIVISDYREDVEKWNKAIASAPDTDRGKYQELDEMIKNPLIKQLVDKHIPPPTKINHENTNTKNVTRGPVGEIKK